MSHKAELNVHDCSLNVFVWYQTLPLTPLPPPPCFLKLCNYSSYGISNTPDILQCQQDQNQPYSLCTASAAARLSDNRLPTNSLPHTERIKTWGLGEEDLCFSVFCWAASVHPFMCIFGRFAGWETELPGVLVVSFYQLRMLCLPCCAMISIGMGLKHSPVFCCFPDLQTRSPTGSNVALLSPLSGGFLCFKSELTGSEYSHWGGCPCHQYIGPVYRTTFSCYLAHLFLVSKE